MAGPGSSPERPFGSGPRAAFLLAVSSSVRQPFLTCSSGVRHCAERMSYKQEAARACSRKRPARTGPNAPAGFPESLPSTAPAGVGHCGYLK